MEVSLSFGELLWLILGVAACPGIGFFVLLVGVLAFMKIADWAK